MKRARRTDRKLTRRRRWSRADWRGLVPLGVALIGVLGSLGVALVNRPTPPPLVPHCHQHPDPSESPRAHVDKFEADLLSARQLEAGARKHSDPTTIKNAQLRSNGIALR